jgi:hypothetical protein
VADIRGMREPSEDPTPASAHVADEKADDSAADAAMDDDDEFEPL